MAGPYDNSTIHNKGINRMNIKEIKFLYDMDDSMTLEELSIITGEMIDDLHFILTCTDEEYEQ